MEIRPATAADVPAVLPMVEKICRLHEAWDPAKYGYLPNIQEGYSRWLIGRTKEPRSVFLVADRDSKVVAYLVGTVETEIPIYRLKEYGFIHDLWVETDYRHEGIARQMTMLAIERFKEIGVHQIRLDTVAPNNAARSLFTSCGFRPSITEMLIEL